MVDTRYAWILTDFEGSTISGPAGAVDEDLAAATNGAVGSQQFHLLDGDGLQVASGRIFIHDPALRCGELLFAPLDDYGMPSLGATDIQYNHRGTWQIL